MIFFQNMFFLKKKHVFLPKMASVTLHIPTDFWWHRIFGSATIFWVRKVWSTWSRGGGVHGEVSWPIDYINDLTNATAKFDHVMYDYITLISTLENFGPTNNAKELEQNINDEISKVATWLQCNKLKLKSLNQNLCYFTNIQRLSLNLTY